MANVNIYDMADTWNAGGTTFTSIKMNVTDTASAAASLLMDLQVGTSSKFTITKGGFARASDGSNAAPAYSYTGLTTMGLYRSGASMVFANSSADIWWTGTSTIVMRNNGTYAFSSGTTVGSASDIIISRAAAATLAVRGASSAAATITTGAYTVTTLPDAGTAGASARAFVSDANATTFASIVAGGGSNGVPVYSDGTNWRIG